MAADRVTVTLPAEVVRDIDRRERNRSKFILEAVRRELKRRRRVELHRSLCNPRPESRDLAELGLRDWASQLSPDDCAGLVDAKAARAVRWEAERRLGRGPEMRIERRTVVLVELNRNVGHEQKGMRPCVIVSDPEATADQHCPMLCIVPITGTAGEGALSGWTSAASSFYSHEDH